MSIRCYPKEEQPREKALLHGIETLSNIELLAILIRCGSKNYSAIDLSKDILNFVGGLENLSNASYSLLSSIKGLKESKTLTLMAAIELAKRINYKKEYLERIDSPESVYNLFEPLLRNEDQEINYCIFLNSKRKIITYKEIYKGGLSVHLVHPRDIFREAIKYNSAAIILVHNHPSGDSTPSDADIATTSELALIGQQLGINIVDHIIIGKGEYFSLKSNKLF